MRRGFVAALAAAVVAFTTAPSADAAWTEPETIPGPKVLAGPVLDTNGRGGVAMAWADVDGIEVAFARAGGRFGPPERIPGHSFDEPSGIAIALDTKGAAVVAWEDCVKSLADPLNPDDAGCRSVIRAAARAPGRAFGSSTRVSDPQQNSFSPRVALAGTRPTVTWDELGGGILTSRASERGHFERRRYVVFGFWPSLAIARHGVEQYLYAPPGPGIAVVSRTRAGRVGRKQLISRSTPTYYLEGSFAANGDLFALWDEGDATLTLSAGIRHPGGHLRARRLARHTSYGTYKVAMDATANGFVATAFVWDGTPSIPLTIARRAPGRGFGSPQALSEAHSMNTPGVAVNPAGRTLVGWLDSSAAEVDALLIGVDGARLHSRRFPFLGGTDYNCVNARYTCPVPAVALDRRGDGYLVWREENSLRYTRWLGG
jgi:hypothetical protein